MTEAKTPPIDSVERWLRDSVAPVYDAMQNAPDRAIDAEEVFATIRAHHLDRVNTQKSERASGLNGVMSVDYVEETDV